MEINLLRAAVLVIFGSLLIGSALVNALKRLGDETKMSTEAPTNLYATLDEVGPLAGKVTIIERVKVGMG